jgi:hypothetical protein
MTTPSVLVLLPCPFCAGKFIIPELARNKYYFYCQDCECCGGASESRELAYTKWNNRARIVIAKKETPYDNQPLPASNGWKPIETAPKDGTEILGYFGGLDVIYWRENKSYPKLSSWCHHCDITLINPKPTHWMPLPAAPRMEKIA